MCDGPTEGLTDGPTDRRTIKNTSNKSSNDIIINERMSGDEQVASDVLFCLVKITQDGRTFRWMDGWMNGRTDKTSDRDPKTHLKRYVSSAKMQNRYFFGKILFE